MESERRKKVALIQAIGTANPPTCYLQADYPELYFEITKSQHLPHLKDKLKRICVNSKIKKRYMLPMEEIVEKNPNIRTYGAPSLDARQDILVEEVPKLAMEAAMKAIEEWGEPAASITHLVFCTSSEISAPSADRRLAKLIGLKPSVQVVAENIEQCLAETFAPLGVENWNELFYAVHTGGAAILRGMQEKLGLAEGKLDASWSVLSEYGNMGSPCVLFVLDALRKKSMGEGRSTTGDGLEMGVLVGFGPGLTVETVALKSVPLKATKK
ncbi:unnamed protein product [Bemisia tabaci]|uniref:Chalcone/stilbene synthase N-terminal domain-containing protein n=1 Tax=Bemisia tabaci TaxID=7038 RepID=A0A9P0ANG8_BEMTA|nr:unnamed protein product [Bemisia tabaci]